MAKSSISISLFFTLLCLWSSTADQDLTSRVERLEETNLEQRREISAQNETLEKLTADLSFVQTELKSKARQNDVDTLEKELQVIQQNLPELWKNGSMNIAQTKTCGGSITVHTMHEISYQQSRTESDPKWCIWIVKNSNHHNLILNLTKREEEQGFQLWTISNFTARSNSTSQKIDGLGTRYSIPESYFALYLRIKSSTDENNIKIKPISFNLNIRSTKFSPAQSQRVVNRIDQSANSSLQPFNYPLPLPRPLPQPTAYSANERTFIVLNPTESGNSLRLIMKSVNTESTNDYIQIITFSGRPISGPKFSGVVRRPQNFSSAVDEPLLVFFASDSSLQRSGFSFNYTEEKKETTKELTTCGGFVSVIGETVISYAVPSSASSSVCIWVVKNELAGGFQVKLTDKTKWAEDNSIDLFIIDSIKGNDTQKIPVTNENQSVNSSDSYFLLYFRFDSSVQGQGFSLLLKDNAEESTVKEELVSHTELTPSSKLSEKKDFSYPVGSSHYSNNERAFIIIKPNVVGSKIEIGMADYEIEKNDKVQFSSLSYSKENKTMAFESSFSGTFLKPRPIILNGTVDEPVILFFSSDRSGVSKGFKFTYSAINGTL